MTFKFVKMQYNNKVNLLNIALNKYKRIINWFYKQLNKTAFY